VSWALSTAEAMWARGDHLEGIKWVRKAAEAASDAENDERHLELAKAASELASLIARRSRASVGEGPGYAGGAPPEAQRNAVVSAPTTARSSALPPAAPPAPSSASRPPPGAKSGPPGPRSVPPGPLPLPSRASSPPRASVVPRAAPRPISPLATSEARQGPQAGRGILTNRTAADATTKTKARRRSRENLDVEAKAAGVLDTAPQTAVDGATADRALDKLAHTSEVTAVVTGATAEEAVSSARSRRRSRPEPDPTIIGNRDDLLQAERAKSAEHWDASPTENLTGDEMDHMNEGDRKTTAFALPKVRTPSAVPPPMRAPTSTVHDPEIQTSQAVRVVVWRDGHGVHIAPAGTVVSSITIDAVLVVLEPSADLTAWLSQRER
jgi:hypothetical protein